MLSRMHCLVLSILFSDLPIVSHLMPVKPTGQLHFSVVLAKSTKHDPPFRHVTPAQGFPEDGIIMKF